MSTHALSGLPKPKAPINPVDECPELELLEPGEPPMLPKSVWDEFGEWFDSWNNEKALRKAGIVMPGPVLLHGPTGTGKSMLTKSIAKSMVGRMAVVLEVHRIVDSYLGGTGRGIDKMFRACERAQALLVMEEIDGLTLARGADRGSCSTENARITVTLMRMIEKARFPIVATTNRLDDMDPALLRRFEFKIALEPLPEAGRRALLKEVLGEEPSAEILELSLHEAMPMVQRIKRLKFINSLKK